MRIRVKRRNFVWLGILAGMIGVAALSREASGEVILTLIGILTLAGLASIIEVKPEQFVDRSRTSLTSMRMSAEAREAVERARRRGGYLESSLTLLDVGLITSFATRDGMTMRRTRDVMKDDDGVRPFITLHVQPRSADRTATIRFEFIDQNGEQQYVHEMRTFLRDGEMNILADHHMPLFGNERIPQTGDWDLRVYLDGSLVAAYSFTMIPSTEERFAHLQTERGARTAPQNDLTGERTALERAAAERAAAERAVRAGDQPMSLEELLRSRNQNNGSK